MKNSFQKLQEIVRLPENPIDVDDVKYESIARELGTRIPADFLEFSRTFGSGTLIAENEEGGYDWEIFSAFRPGFFRILVSFPCS